MLTKDDMDAVDMAIRSALIARKEELRLSDEKLGKQAFGFLKAPHGKVQSLLVGQGKPDEDTGKRKPQVIKIGELYNLCEALGLSWQEVQKAAIRSAIS